jgi:hypothetical protein
LDFDSVEDFSGLESDLALESEPESEPESDPESLDVDSLFDLEFSPPLP